MSDEMDARREAARADAASSSEWWDQVPGAVIEGMVTDVGQATVQKGQGKGKVYTVLTIEHDNGNSQKVGCMRTVLADKVAEKGVEAGMYVRIECTGERSTDAGGSYFTYSLGVA